MATNSKRRKPAPRGTAARSGGRRHAPQRSTPSRTWLVVAALSVAAVVAGLLLTNRAGKSSGPPPRTTAGATAVTGGDFHSLLADPATAGRLFAGGHAAVSGTAAWGAVLLVLYSFGLGLPFVLLALGFSRAQRSLGWLRRHGRQVEVAGGVLMLGVGLLFVSGRWGPLFRPMQRWFAELGWPPI